MEEGAEGAGSDVIAVVKVRLVGLILLLLLVVVLDSSLISESVNQQKQNNRINIFIVRPNNSEFFH